MSFLIAFSGLAIVCALLSYVLRGNVMSTAAVIGETKNAPAQIASFRSFQKTYLAVFLLMMMGDWLQGPYVYALYQSYGYSQDPIAKLFIAGFLSSAIFGTVIGSFADTRGRKRMALVFCVVYSLSCLTKLSANFWILLFGRLLAGIATSLLFSVFESWMVCEHTKAAYPAEWLSQTFSWATWGNGLAAILSGVVANYFAETWGLVSPFMVAIACFGVGAAVILKGWDENYGQPSENSWTKSIVDGIKISLADYKILSIGMIQSLFESAMYSFVFMWTPALQRGLDASKEIALPFGLIFAAYMVAVMIGSLLFGWSIQKFSAEQLARICYFIAALTMFAVIYTQDQMLTFWCFIAFETCCGFHFPLIGTLRSKYIPENARSAVMNLVRVPLNLIVVVVLLKVASMEISSVFAICSLLLFICTGLAFSLPGAAAAVAPATAASQ